MSWYLFILGFLAVLAFCRALAGKRNAAAAEKGILLAACALLLFFMAFRAESVGADTRQYTTAFEQIRNMSLGECLTKTVYGAGGNHAIGLEYGYRLYNWLLGQLFRHPQAVTAANSVLIIFLLYRFIRLQSRYALFCIWLYVTFGLFQTEMNMARNAIAILWCLCASRYIEEKKPLLYAANVLGAALFHQTALFFLILYPLSGIRITARSFKYLILTAMAAGFGIFLVKPWLHLVIPERYERYLYVTSPDTEGLVLGAFYFAVILAVLLMLRRENRSAALEISPVGNWCFLMNVFSFCVSYTLIAATRAAALFSPYFIVYIPQLLERGVRSESRKRFIAVCVTVFCGIVYVLRLTVNNIGGTMPYVFFWQQP